VERARRWEISELDQRILIISVSSLSSWLCMAAKPFAHCFASVAPRKGFGVR